MRRKTKGLNFFEGSVKKIKSKKLPNIGWKLLNLKATGLKSFQKMNSILFTLVKYFKK